MDKGTKNYRDMMKRMEKDDPAIINPTRPSGMMGGTPDMLRPDNEVAKQLEELKMQNKPEESNTDIMKEKENEEMERKKQEFLKQQQGIKKARF